jgi:hypothetical protein
MSWVRRTDRPAGHECAPPIRQVTYAIPPPPGAVDAAAGRTFTVAQVDGRRGDLWRCVGCRRLWRVGLACGWCDTYGTGPHAGQCQMGSEWRPATLWQRIRHRR